MMKTIVVSSNNPVKIQAAQAGFQRMFPGETFTVQTAAVPSGVSDQPFTRAETLCGALNRATAARLITPGADYWVGIEGGVEVEEAGRLAVFAWVVVLGDEPGGQTRISKSQTGVFYLPARVAELVQQGKELGEADDIVFGRSNSKQETGSVGILTHNVLGRAEYYEQAVILSLIPFLNPQLYPAEI